MAQSPDLEFITIKNNVQVGVSKSLNLITSYVLKEQGDWFEDEIEFIRHFIKPGMHVIDIGANHGVYALTMANLVGPKGHVWAIEPDPIPMGRLRASVLQNNFSNITLIEAGLSNHDGRAPLFTSGHSELNTLTPTTNRTTCEIVLKTLDGCRTEFGMNGIDYIKLDAEGEEKRILEKASILLSNESPLIMFELKHGDQINLPLVEQFSSLGYDCYRLVPGLNLLVPFTPETGLDGFLLNLFACKKERAQKLEADGFLAQKISQNVIATNGDQAIWQNYLAQFPYAQLLMQEWQYGPKERGWETYEHALYCYVRAHGLDSSPQERFLFLQDSLQLLSELMPDLMSFARSQTLARVAWEIGMRSTAVNALSIMIKMFREKQELKLDEPFLCVCPSYDRIEIQPKLFNWCFASILEQHETLRSFSTFFADPVMSNLETFATLGIPSDQMNNRLRLVKQRSLKP